MGLKLLLLFSVIHSGVYLLPLLKCYIDGRRQYVKILDCYLKRNLVSNGGYLDQVHFISNTDNNNDLKYLEDLLKTSDRYKEIRPGALGLYDEMWGYLTNNDTIYIKIDDDVVSLKFLHKRVGMLTSCVPVFIHDDAIPRLVMTLTAHPEVHLVSANLINSAISNWLHYHTDAIFPYLPEASPRSDLTTRAPSWRPSSLERLREVPNTEWYFPEVPYGGFNLGEPGAPPFQGHRWLPLDHTAENMLKTPIVGAQYDAENGIHHQWAIAAQEHYSFFENLERNQLDKYWCGNKEGIWNLQYQRHNLNFVAIWGSSVAKMLPGRQDETDLFVTIPRALKKREISCRFGLLNDANCFIVAAVIDSHAIVSHFSFWPQQRDLLKTDLLDRYKAYADETVCGLYN